MPPDLKVLITDTTRDASVSNALRGVSDAWKDAVPDGILAGLVLERKQTVLKFPERKAVFIQAGGRWGPAKGNIALYVRHAERQPLEFVVVTSVSTLDSSDIFEDSALVTEIKSQLPPSTADVCVLREWPGAGRDSNHAIPREVKHALDVVQDVETLLGSSSTSKHTGLVVRFKLDFANGCVPPTDSVLDRLRVIDRFTGTTSITSLLLHLGVARTTDAKPLTTFVFSASIDALPILHNTILKDISLSMTVIRPASPSPPNVTLKLTGKLILGAFDTEKRWASVGTLTIDKASNVAELVVAPADKKQSLAELGGIKLGNVQLYVKYTFGKPKATWDASLTAHVIIGSRIVDGTVAFKDSHPSYLLSPSRGHYNELPKDFIELSLTDVNFCYSWDTDTLLLQGRHIEPGLTASALVDVFGIKFKGQVTFVPSGKDKGVDASAKLAHPIDLTIISLYEKYNMCAGPRITYLAKDSQPKHLTVDGGFSILGLHFEETKIRYGARSTNDKQTCLNVDVELECSVVEGGKIPLHLEIFKVKDRTHVHLNGIPLTEILDAFKDAMLFDKIRKLTQADPCKEINIPLKDILEMSFWPKVEFSEKQPAQEKGQPRRCAFDVSFTWAVRCALTKTKVTELSIDLFPPAPAPQPIKSKRTEDGKEVSLTEEFQKLILKIRTEAPIIIICLEDILQMLGEGDPTKVKPNLPMLPIPANEKPTYINYTKLLLELFKKIRDRDWDSTTWNDDYKLITRPFGFAWDPDMDLWTGLHEVQIHLGLLAKAYQPVGQGIMFQRNESTWPKNGEADSRLEVEVFHKIDMFTSGLTYLTFEAKNINSSLSSVASQIFDVLVGVGKPFVEPPNPGTTGKPHVKAGSPFSGLFEYLGIGS